MDDIKLFEIRGKKDSELNGVVFGQFTTRELAEDGHKIIIPEFRDETEVVESNLFLNALERFENDKSIITDLTEQLEPEKILAKRREDNYVEGYVTVHLSDIIDNDYPGFCDLLSRELVGNELLGNMGYTVVGFKDSNHIVFKVCGYADFLEEE